MSLICFITLLLSFLFFLTYALLLSFLFSRARKWQWLQNPRTWLLNCLSDLILFHFFLRNRCMRFQSKHKKTNLFRILFYMKDSQVPFEYPHFLTCYYFDVKCWAWHVLLIPKLFLRNTPFCSIRAHTEVLKALWKARSKEFIILLCAHA